MLTSDRPHQGQVTPNLWHPQHQEDQPAAAAEASEETGVNPHCKGRLRGKVPQELVNIYKPFLA